MATVIMENVSSPTKALLKPLFKEREQNPGVANKLKHQSKSTKSLKHTKKVSNNRNMGAGRLKN